MSKEQDTVSASSNGSANGLPSSVMVGLDVGSTTVKAVVMDPDTDEILWKEYERHNTKQPEMVNDFLRKIQEAFPLPQDKIRIFITGSGGTSLKDFIGAKFVQEVNAVSLAVEHLYPDAGSVIELGGQDAKIIIWFTDKETGAKRKVPSMNDKCAGGTGAVIDKINSKLRLTGEQLQALDYYDVKLHPVAGKCGVFAETDINGLQKQGVPPDQLMASLFEAIIQQNLSVLTRGNTLRPTVLLLGGPNSYIPAMRDCWKHNIPKIWAERGTELPEGIPPEDLVIVPGERSILRSDWLGSLRQERGRPHRCLQRHRRIGRIHGRRPRRDAGTVRRRGPGQDSRRVGGVQEDLPKIGLGSRNILSRPGS